jgi:hypothetical protein
MSGATQEPHCSVPPQPSPALPQLMFCWAHVSGVQTPASGAPH